MVRVVAGWDPAQAKQRRLWPLRDLLLAYVAILKREAEERYRHDRAIWAALWPYQKRPDSAPRPPRILRG